MNRLLALTLFVSVAFAGQAPQTPDPDTGLTPGEFFLYSSSIGHKLTVKWGGTLMSEIDVPYGVMLEIKGTEKSNPERSKSFSFPWILRGKLRIRLKVFNGETGPASEVMKTAPWELNLDDAEIRVEPAGRVTPVGPQTGLPADRVNPKEVD